MASATAFIAKKEHQKEVQKWNSYRKNRCRGVKHGLPGGKVNKNAQQAQTDQAGSTPLNRAFADATVKMDLKSSI